MIGMMGSAVGTTATAGAIGATGLGAGALRRLIGLGTGTDWTGFAASISLRICWSGSASGSASDNDTHNASADTMNFIIVGNIVG